MTRTSKVLLGLAAVAIVQFSRPATAQDTGLVTVRATPGLPDAAVEYIARVAEPRRVDIPANRAPEELITEVCGARSKKFLELYDKLNTKPNSPPPRARTQTARTIVIPACIRWQRNVTVKVGAQQTLDSILLSYIGRKSDEQYTCPEPGEDVSRRCNKTFRDLVQDENRGKNLDDLRAKDELVLPFITERVTFKIAKLSSLTAQQVSDEIGRLGRTELPASPIIRNFVASPVQLIGPKAPSDPDVQASTCKQASQLAQAANRPWPYDAELISRVLARNVRQRDKHGHAAHEAVLAIVDTGLDPNFPSNLLRSDDTAAKNRVGLGVYVSERMAPLDGYEPYEKRMHGTHVAHIATGGYRLRETLLKLKGPRLKIVNAVEKFGAKIESEEFELTSGGVDRGVAWAVENAQVINVSIGSEIALPGFVNALRNNRQVLAVVAAGNESSRLGVELTMYPANYGGQAEQIPDQVITVAAHDATLARAPFSNRGQYADLLAPGCDIPFADGTAGLHGTSFAAPLVSMTASLLHVFGIRAPLKIKKRLRVSSDFDEKLGNDVLWSARLNIPKALSVYDDVLELSNGVLKFGIWPWRDKWLEVCADGEPNRGEIPVRDISKISVLSDRNPLKIRVSYRDLEDKLLSAECRPDGEGLTFASRDDNDVWDKPNLIPWNQFKDLVIRSYFPEQSQVMPQ